MAQTPGETCGRSAGTRLCLVNRFGLFCGKRLVRVFGRGPDVNRGRDRHLRALELFHAARRIFRLLRRRLKRASGPPVPGTVQGASAESNQTITSAQVDRIAGRENRRTSAGQVGGTPERDKRPCKCGMNCRSMATHRTILRGSDPENEYSFPGPSENGLDRSAAFDWGSILSSCHQNVNEMVPELVRIVARKAGLFRD